ncbi:MAG TPA: hypothetical protein VI636_08120 [Candidatus Angelobacter sp.]
MRAFVTMLVGGLMVASLTSCGGGGSTPPPPPPTVSVTPNAATVTLGGTQQFMAVLSTGAITTATWSVNGVQGGNSTVGTIDSTGKYTGPGSFPSPNTLTVTANAAAGTAMANLTVAFPNNNHTAQTTPIQLGTTGGNSTDLVKGATNVTCCSGTLGSLVIKGGLPFILSNNHVLFKSDAGSSSDPVQQPGLVDNNCDQGAPPPPFTTVSNQIQAAPLKPSPCTGTCTGASPSNVDAAIAQVIAGTVDPSGAILDLGAAGSTSIAAAPPSSNPAPPPATVLATNEGVAKSGRSTGLTCSNLQAVNASVSVQYNASCGGAVAFTSTFSNQIVINGANFSASGDSGSLVVTSDTARPLGLLFAGNATSTTANSIQDVITALGFAFPVGNPDHAVSCAPTATASSASTTMGASAAKLSTQENDRVTAVKEKHANRLLANPEISDVSVGASADSPEEGALVITVRGATGVPAVIDGVRTRVVYAGSTAPRASMADISRATAVKEVHASGLMNQPGIQGVGVGVSDDNAAEPAMVIYVISGTQRPQIPAVMDGLRTKIVEGDRFRAFGWGKDTKPSCSKKPQSNLSTTAGRLPKLP